MGIVRHHLCHAQPVISEVMNECTGSEALADFFGQEFVASKDRSRDGAFDKRAKDVCEGLHRNCHVP